MANPKKSEKIETPAAPVFDMAALKDVLAKMIAKKALGDQRTALIDAAGPGMEAAQVDALFAELGFATKVAPGVVSSTRLILILGTDRMTKLDKAADTAKTANPLITSNATALANAAAKRVIEEKLSVEAAIAAATVAAKKRDVEAFALKIAKKAAEMLREHQKAMGDAAKLDEKSLAKLNSAIGVIESIAALAAE